MNKSIKLDRKKNIFVPMYDDGVVKVKKIKMTMTNVICLIILQLTPSWSSLMFTLRYTYRSIKVVCPMSDC